MSDTPGDLTIPGPAERARRNAALAANGTETGFWDDHGRPAPGPKTSITGTPKPANPPPRNPENNPPNPHPGPKSTAPHISLHHNTRNARTVTSHQPSTTTGATHHCPDGATNDRHNHGA
ncbi:hypothetical protein Phou_015560 [Phytohabitans houttuyneae]|uniref:Uncharacterized protein n=1 Tax=Phytohabitans houttuyneae TaxID=1076126 RepID=A0A6V8K5W4_9ACTN|nr:hypothetical protein Phou_015560 [Phytohabitans houttuyneae]